MSLMNRLSVAANPYQGKHKKVLCVCSGGVLRSPTAAYLLAIKYGYNTRAVGTDTEFALVPADKVLVEWADEIICMEESHAMRVRKLMSKLKPVVVLDIEDMYPYRDPQLCTLILDRYAERSNEGLQVISGGDERGCVAETSDAVTGSTEAV